ncbi:hypothetical protein M4D70_03505 [Brevibacillus borstelensis]|uniref:hypothetical protein n=1 Tax=Brevibacillus borstelensis TaxID=45462 RepID=UPI00203AF2A3|nr:hypothetical protein [Brevibacillus borstelensis]MCM3621326.1 hypothetical protein [Brevibacillus borstelensis]
MRDLIEQLATQYASDLDTQLDSGNGQRSIQNPVLFLFIGDNSLEALQAVYSLNERQWKNHAGALYLHASSGKTLSEPRVYGCRLPEPLAGRQTLRSDIYSQFYQQEPLRVEINKVMKKVSIHLAEAGGHCPSVQHVNIAVVTRADDPANVLVPELVLLMKSYLSEVFKYVSIDLYALIQEKSSGDDFGFSASLSVSFLEELTNYQRSDYRFKESLQVTEDHVTLEVAHAGSPLFSLIYLLSDKNERGLFAENGQKDNYEIISRLVLLNNKPAEPELGEGNESYNKHQFTRSITVDNVQTAFATAGFSKVKQPKDAIALTVLSHVYDDLLERMKTAPLPDPAGLMERLELAPRHILRSVQSILPDGGKLDEMTGLMATGVSYAELRSMTLREAEHALFQGSSQAFFEMHFEQRARKQLESLQIKEKFARLFRETVAEDPRCGPYAACQLTSGNETLPTIRGELLARIRETARLLEETRAEWEDLYRQRVEQQDFKKGGFFTREKDRIRNFIRHLLPLVYGKRYELLGLEMELRLLRDCEQQAEELHRQLAEEWGQLERQQKQLRELAQKSVKEATDYLGKNIDQYYGTLVREAIRSLEAKKGPLFYWEDRYLGQKASILNGGQTESSALIERLSALCRQEILSSPLFALAFEDELLARANVAVAYENRDVLTKEELFEDLDRALEERASVHVEVFHFSQKHRYEEKYFFADIDSDFIQYVMQKGQGLRTCKQGCIHEAGTSGIEKLHLMGGFGLGDLMYYRNNKKYYDSYVANGFVFHRREKGVSI